MDPRLIPILFGGGAIVPPPDGWGGASRDFEIRKRGRTAYTNINWAARAPRVDSNVFVDVDTGSDANPGTPAQPFKTLRKAVHGVAGALGVYARGNYTGANSFNDANPTATALVIRPWGPGRVKSSMEQTGLSWSLTAATTATYEATIVTVGAVADHAVLNLSGDFPRLTLQTSVANVDANPGSYYVSGTTVYVRRAGSTIPDDNVKVYENKRNFLYNVPDGVLWMAGFDFEGGNRVCQVACTTDQTKSNTAYIIGCSMKYSAASRNGLNVDGACRVYVNQCVVAQNSLDGLGYQRSGVSGPAWALEEGVIARDNGHEPGGGISNSTSMHEGGTIFRVGGLYTGAQDRSAHDVGNSFSHLICCSSSGSRSAAGSTRVNYAAGTNSPDATQMYLDSCDGADGTGSNFRSEDASIIRIRNFGGALSQVAGTDLRYY